MKGNAIEAKGLTKKFGKFVAVDRINLSIKKGEVFGFLGPNGAGKTTTIKMLATLLRPTSGSATVAGFDVSKNPNDVRKAIGIVFQDPAVDSELTGEENLDFHARMYSMPANQRSERVSYVLNLVDLAQHAKQFVKTYSGGMRRRLEIARGLIHAPQVLFLDEPTLGLDPQTRRHVWEYIRKLNKEEGVTILLTTHYMEEADSLCNRIGIIDKGKLLVVGTSEELKAKVGEDLITVKTAQGGKLAGIVKKAKIGAPVAHDSELNISVKSGEEKIPKILKLAEKGGIDVKSISLRKPTLEDVFLSYTGKTIRAGEADSKEAFRMMARMHGGRR